MLFFEVIDTSSKKLVAIVNEKIEVGVAMNALAHCSLAIGAKIGENFACLTQYIDKNEEFNWPLSAMPFIILKGTSGEIKKAVRNAGEGNIQHTAFTDTATGGTWEEQILRTKEKTADEFTYYAAVLCGDFEAVKAITKKFSLFR